MFRKWFGKGKDEAKEGAAEAAADATPAASEPPAAEAPAEAEPEKRSRWSLFSKALKKTKTGLKGLFSFRRPLDEAYVDEIEADLYSADFGPEAVDAFMNGPEGVRAAWKERRIAHSEDVREFLKARLKGMLTRRSLTLARAETPPTVILVAGVNGTGKTTSVAKLAKKLRDEGNSVILAAADTFRAAAVEQLTVWSERVGVELVRGKPEAQPASVAYMGAEAAIAKKADYLIVDTAGRLHTQVNLMQELRKIREVLGKKVPGAPHESLLVLDATTGQNALNQARLFQKEVQLTGIILAKLDGTAKGGIVVSINNLLEIPVKFVGVGEALGDLEVFDVDSFVDAIFE